MHGYSKVAVLRACLWTAGLKGEDLGSAKGGLVSRTLIIWAGFSVPCSNCYERRPLDSIWLTPSTYLSRFLTNFFCVISVYSQHWEASRWLTKQRWTCVLGIVLKGVFSCFVLSLVHITLNNWGSLIYIWTVGLCCFTWSAFSQWEERCEGYW